ncbi:MAG: precorrin-6y C5,15-methyltransferase (decarboxylating) subunit CbiE [Actinocrinis sp.]
MSAHAGITVIGYDGTPLTPEARLALDRATLVVGGMRHLDALVSQDSGVARVMLGPLATALEALAAHDGPASVLASGDPGFFGILRALREAGLEPEAVLPAVSSVAAAFARAGIAWDDAVVVSAHGSGDGRELRRAANVCRARPKVALLTGPGAGPAQLARELLHGAGDAVVQRVLVVAQRLGHSPSIINRPNQAQWINTENPKTSSYQRGPKPATGPRDNHDGDESGSGSGKAEGDGDGADWLGERVEWLSLVEAAQREDFTEPNVVLCLAPSALPAGPGEATGSSSTPRLLPSKRWLAGWAGHRGEWAVDESSFAHRDGQVTKAEVRAHVLPRLAPSPGDLVWDIGAGSGSVGIECAAFGAAVVAVERDDESCTRIAANAAAHGVELSVCCGKAPDVLPALPQPDAVFVGGGGVEVVRAVLTYRPARVVVALAGVERVGPVVALLESDGRSVGGVLSQSSRMAALPDGTHRFVAVNPVYVVWGVSCD